MKNLLLSLALLGNIAFASDSVMVVEDSAWARATPPGATTTAIYLTVMNHSSDDINLTAANSDISDRLELHTHKSENGMMKMLQVESISVAAGEQTALKPHAEHIMVFNLAKPLKEGEQVNVELTFDDGNTLTLTVPVNKNSPESHAGHMKHDMQKDGEHAEQGIEKPDAHKTH